MNESAENLKTIAEKKRKKFIYRNALWGYLFILPAAIFLITFSYIPLIMAFFRSFQSYSTGLFVGLKNFQYILQTPTFIKSIGNVLILAGSVVALQSIFSFFMAHLILRLPGKWANFVKIAIYIPCMMSGVIAYVIFNLFLRYNRGFFDSLMLNAGLDPIYFAQDGLWPYISVVVPTIWMGFGYNTLLMLSGRRSIPKEYYEAAKIDGCGPVRAMLSITVPNMSNYFILMLVNLITTNLQMLEIPMFITGGGPLEATITPCMYLFQSFSDAMRDRNITIAGSFLVMIPITLLNIIAFTCIRSKKSEDS